MPTPQIQIGVATDILQNVVYALPARKCFVQGNAALEVAVKPDFVVPIAVTTAGLSTSAAFVRCTVSAATIIAKADD